MLPDPAAIPGTLEDLELAVPPQAMIALTHILQSTEQDPVNKALTYMHASIAQALAGETNRAREAARQAARCDPESATRHAAHIAVLAEERPVLTPLIAALLTPDRN
jgi:hypothetical protein